MNFILEKVRRKIRNKKKLIFAERPEKSLEQIRENGIYSQKIASIGSWLHNLQNNQIYLTEGVYHILGWSSQEFGEKSENYFNNAIKLVHPEDRYKLKDAMERHLKEESYQIEFRIPQLDGTIKYVIGKGEPIFDNKGRVIGIIGTLQDITEKKLLEEKLEKNQEDMSKIQRKLEVLIQESSDVFEILDPDGTIKYISAASERVIGYKPEERIGKKLYDYYQGEELQKVRKMIEFLLDNPCGKVQGDVLFKNKMGKEIYLEVHAQNLLHEPAVNGIVVNFRDITKRVEMEKKMDYISTHDELTGLPNRINFKDKLQKQCEYAKITNNKFAVMMLDINGFKYINDALGYMLGDQLIVSIANRLKSFFCNTNYICRYSADCFGIIIQGLSTFEEYETIAKRIVELFNHTFKVDRYELDVTMCMGISIWQDEVQDADYLINHAEIALFWAKRAGKNRYIFYSSDINIQNYKHFELRNDLRKAMKNNEFQVFYQPIVNLKTNEILAAEALIRWEHPIWGLVSSNEFIKLAEEMWLITNIGDWVLREVCRNYKQWIEKKLPEIKVCVNFSSIQFFENNFVENIKNTIDEFGLDPHFLVMEITESTFMAKAERTIADIKRLQSYGIQVALDDFGTGYSSLAYLNSFNIDILKIDGSFIKNSISNKTSSIITRSIINMAQELKIKVVAEGIENLQQLSYLRHLNCHTGQGYIYAKPMPLRDFEEILIKRKCVPAIVNNFELKSYKNRRKFFRIKFPLLLEADLTILEIRGKKVNVGNTKVLVEDMGPGGLCFTSNIKFPIGKDIILQFITQLIEREIKVYGCCVWMNEIENNLFKYGVQFTFDEDERVELIKILNQVQIKIRKSTLFTEGNFVSVPPEVYFKSQTD